MDQNLPQLLNRMIGVHTKDEILKLRKGKVVIVGVGCDGSEVAEQLVRSGIGEITLIDGDVVEESNLNRQRLFAFSDIGTPKVEAAAKRLKDISPYTKINSINEKFSYDNAHILKGHDVIVQGVDSMTVRIMLHEVAQELKIPIVTMSGQPPLRSFVSTVLPGGPLYQDLFNIGMSKPLKEMTTAEREEFDKKLTLDRARHAVEQGADQKWLQNLEKGTTSWSITLGRSPITGTLQTNEVIRLLVGKKPLAVAPNIVVYDGNGLKEFGFPKDICKLMQPTNSNSWDYKIL